MSSEQYALLVAGVISLVATPDFASCGHGDGNTCISFKNKAKANASGFGSFAANVQQNQINFNTADHNQQKNIL